MSLYKGNDIFIAYSYKGYSETGRINEVDDKNIHKWPKFECCFRFVTCRLRSMLIDVFNLATSTFYTQHTCIHVT